MGDEHEQRDETEATTEQVAAGGHQDRAEQWQRDDGDASVHGGEAQDTADQWTADGRGTTTADDDVAEDVAEQWSGDDAASGAQDTSTQWYEEGRGR